MSRFFISILVLSLLFVGLEAARKGRRKPNQSKLLRIKLSMHETNVEVGNPPQKLKFGVSTDVDDTFIGITGCAVPNLLGDKCQPAYYRRAYVPYESKTSSFNSSDPGACTDELHLVDADKQSKFPKFEFGAQICDDISTWAPGCHSGGELGIGPRSLVSKYSFVKQAIQAGLISKPMASVYYKRCQRFSDNNYHECPNDGDVVFGGMDTQNCANVGQTLSVDKNANSWNFQVTNYTFTFNNGKPKSMSGTPNTLVELKARMSSSSQDTYLPSEVYDKFRELAEVEWNKPSFGIDCNAKLQMKFHLKDNKGKTAELTMDQDDLFFEKYDGKCRLNIQGRGKWDGIEAQRQITLGRSLYRSGCVLHDLQNGLLTLSRRLK